MLSAVPPEVPLRGSDKVPLSHLLLWRSEILAAQRVGTMARVEHTTAKAALKAAELSEKIAAERIIASDKRLRTAWWQYHFLVSRMLSFARFSPDSVSCLIVARRYCGG